MAAANITLIGMPGAGKSTLGVVLAKMLNKQFLDADLLIQGLHGATLQELIDERGSEGFIALENDALRTIDVRDTVIATGGSAVYSTGAIDRLRESGPVVYLEISCDELVNRLGDLAERGVVMRGDVRTLRDLFAERAPLYEATADLIVNVDGLTVAQAAQKVRQQVDE